MNSCNGACTELSLSCPPLMRGADLLVEPGAMTLLGEMHGTEEASAALLQLVCHAVQRDDSKGVLVGFEMPANNATAVQAYLDGDGDESARGALLEAPHFTDVTQDGRDSEAIVGALEQLRRWRAAGADIDVGVFDVDSTRPAAGSERDAVMADTLAEAVRERAGATVLVLTGTVHNRTKKGTPWDAEFVPMGMRLRDMGFTLRSLNMRMSGGSMWVCMATPGEQKPTCGEREFSAEDRGPEPFVEFHDAPDEAGFDGIFYVGTAHASPPANPLPESSEQ